MLRRGVERSASPLGSEAQRGKDLSTAPLLGLDPTEMKVHVLKAGRGGSLQHSW